MVSLRLDTKLEQELERTAASLGVSKSEFIRKVLVEKLKEERNLRTPWEMGKSVFGKFGSGSSNRSTDRKKILKNKLSAKKSRH